MSTFAAQVHLVVDRVRAHSPRLRCRVDQGDERRRHQLAGRDRGTRGVLVDGSASSPCPQASWNSTLPAPRRSTTAASAGAGRARSMVSARSARCGPPPRGRSRRDLEPDGAPGRLGAGLHPGVADATQLTPKRVRTARSSSTSWPSELRSAPGAGSRRRTRSPGGWNRSPSGGVSARSSTSALRAFGDRLGQHGDEVGAGPRAARGRDARLAPRLPAPPRRGVGRRCKPRFAEVGGVGEAVDSPRTTRIPRPAPARRRIPDLGVRRGAPTPSDVFREHLGEVAAVAEARSASVRWSTVLDQVASCGGCLS